MEKPSIDPLIFHCLDNDALEVTSTAYGSVGKVYCDGRIEAVWVCANKPSKSILAGFHKLRSTCYWCCEAS